MLEFSSENSSEVAIPGFFFFYQFVVPFPFQRGGKEKKKRKKDEAVQVGREEKRLEAGVHSGQTAH